MLMPGSGLARQQASRGRRASVTLAMSLGKERLLVLLTLPETIGQHLIPASGRDNDLAVRQFNCHQTNQFVGLLCCRRNGFTNEFLSQLDLLSLQGHRPNQRPLTVVQVPVIAVPAFFLIRITLKDTPVAAAWMGQQSLLDTKKPPAPPPRQMALPRRGTRTALSESPSLESPSGAPPQSGGSRQAEAGQRPVAIAGQRKS